MNLLRKAVAASSIVLAGATISVATPVTAQANPLGCSVGFMTLGAATFTNPPAAALLTAGAGTAAIFDQCEMMPKEGVVMDIPAGARCVDLHDHNKTVPCPQRARVSPWDGVA